MAQNRPPWLRLATQRFDNLPARPAPTPAPTATSPQVLAPTPPPPPPRVANAPTSMQSRESVPAVLPPPTLSPRLPPPTPVQPPAPAPPPLPALVPAPTLAPRLSAPTPMQQPAPASPPAPAPPAPAATPARAPSPTPALTLVRPQLPQRQVSQQTPPPRALRPATPPRTQLPSPSPPQRQAFQPAPTRTSPPADAFQAPKSQTASPSPPLQWKGSPPRPQPQTAQPPSSTVLPSPSPVRKPPEIVKNQVMAKYPTAAMEVKQAVLVKDIVPPNSHVVVIKDSEKRNHTPPQHSKINKDAPPSTVAEITDLALPQHSQTNGQGNSGLGLHKNRNSPVRDDEDHGMRIIAISGENKGATMEIIAGRGGAHSVANNDEKSKKDVGNDAAVKEGESAKKGASHHKKPVSAMVNSNVQSINNSIMYGCNCSHNNPGVHLSLHGKPAVFKPQATPTTIALGTSSK